MSLEYTTPVPNRVFDHDMASLREVELKVLLVVIRRTHGWVEENNNRQRKKIQRITIGSFEASTGCSKRAISSAIQSLIQKQLIIVYDYSGHILIDADERKGKYHLYFKHSVMPVENRLSPKQIMRMPYAKFARQPVQNLPNTIKENILKKKNKEKLILTESAQQNSSVLHISNYINKYTL